MPGQSLRPHRFGVGLVGSIALALVMAAPAAAHDPAIDVHSDHAYAGDPLFPLTSGPGLFPGFAADQSTAMGSTTKVMTLIVALDAIRAGVVGLGDVVTISFAAATPGAGSSLMVDDNGVSLQVGERVRFEDLLFGLIIDSGNDAAWAIAEHVAAGYLGQFGSVSSFVALMNSKAGALGLSGTVFQNPSGIDGQVHMTTARDLARIWQAGMADAEFRRFVRPQTWVGEGTFLASTAIKTYTMTKSGSYPGIEGHKNGRTPNCSGAEVDDQCFVGSARRIGRRVVIAGMQSDGVIGGTSGDAAEIWDFAFRRLFHPDPRGGSSLGDASTRLSLVCPTAGRVVSVTMPTTGRPVVTSWATSVTDQTYTSLGRASAPTNALGTTAPTQDREIDAIALSASVVVTATRAGTSTELRVWSIPATGAPSSVAVVSGRTAGSAMSIELVRLSSTMFATVARTTTDEVMVKVYRRATKGVTLLDSYPLQIAGVLEVDAAAAPGQQGLRFAAAIARSGNTFVAGFSANPTTGKIELDDLRSSTLVGTGLSLVPAPVEAMPDEVTVDTFYALGFRRSNGSLVLLYARIDATGAMAALRSGGSAGSITAVELAPFGASGLLAMAQLTNGTLKPIVWETYRDQDLDRNPNGNAVALRVSDHATSIRGAQPEICSTPTTRAEGHFVSGLLEGTATALRLRGWQIAPRP